MLKKADKKEFVEKMFDISVFEQMYKSIHRNVLDFDKESNACQNRLLTLNKTKDDYESQIEKYDINKDAKLKNLNATRNDLQIKLNDLNMKNITTDAKSIAKLEDDIDNLECNRNELHKEISNISNKIS
jgi:DNA repair exonuclease SbcCD ATPase subunit